jgi:spore germination protein PE
MKRTSVVQDMFVSSVQFASTVFVGDNLVVDPRTRAIAVQRERADFLGDEGDFDKYPLFRRPIPQPGLNTTVNLSIVNESPYISVSRVKAVSLSTSAVLQIGSTAIIDAESRIKQFRQLLSADVPKFPAGADAVARAFALSPVVGEQVFCDEEGGAGPAADDPDP